MKRTLFTLLLLLALAVPSALAGIVGVPVGPAAPPATLGSFSLTPWGPDGLSDFVDITSITGGPGGLGLVFGALVSKRTIGDGWATWSNGYTGSVYYSNGATSLSMALTTPVDAFLFYAEPNPFSVFDIEAIAQDGTTLSMAVDGSSGAAGFGFYGDGISKIASIVVTSDVDFAVGEFYSTAGTGVPEPSSLLLLGFGIAGLAFWRRKK